MGNNGSVRIKICGITSVADARLVEAAGADAIGLIFAAGSTRELTPETGQEISRAAGPFLTRVGVFRNQSLEQVLELARWLRLDAVQLHGAEDHAYVAAVAAEFRVIRALAFRPGLSIADLSSWPADHVLLDAPAPGSGTAFDWTAAADLAEFPRLIIAGGLTPHNVAEAIHLFQPAAVDVASGVESEPGRKSSDLVRRFVRSSRAAAAVSTAGDVS